jgi:hypothetical protein
MPARKPVTGLKFANTKRLFAEIGIVLSHFVKQKYEREEN